MDAVAGFSVAVAGCAAAAAGAAAIGAAGAVEVSRARSGAVDRSDVAQASRKATISGDGGWMKRMAAQPTPLYERVNDGRRWARQAGNRRASRQVKDLAPSRPHPLAPSDA